jgi:hypothetical protein
MTVRRREEEEDGGDDEPCAVRARGVENAPLHSPQLTQRRTHPAVIHSTPAGEQQRPRIRRCHEEKTRGQADCIPTGGLTKRDGVSNIGHGLVRQPVDLSSSCFGTVTLATTFWSTRSIRQSNSDQPAPILLRAAGERR